MCELTADSSLSVCPHFSNFSCFWSCGWSLFQQIKPTPHWINKKLYKVLVQIINTNYYANYDWKTEQGTGLWPKWSNSGLFHCVHQNESLGDEASLWQLVFHHRASLFTSLKPENITATLSPVGLRETSWELRLTCWKLLSTFAGN